VPSLYHPCPEGFHCPETWAVVAFFFLIFTTGIVFYLLQEDNPLAMLDWLRYEFSIPRLIEQAIAGIAGLLLTVAIGVGVSIAATDPTPVIYWFSAAGICGTLIVFFLDDIKEMKSWKRILFILLTGVVAIFALIFTDKWVAEKAIAASYANQRQNAFEGSIEVALFRAAHPRQPIAGTVPPVTIHQKVTASVPTITLQSGNLAERTSSLANQLDDFYYVYGWSPSPQSANPRYTPQGHMVIEKMPKAPNEFIEWRKSRSLLFCFSYKNSLQAVRDELASVHLKDQRLEDFLREMDQDNGMDLFPQDVPEVVEALRTLANQLPKGGS
jgi:hypothetical protein